MEQGPRLNWNPPRSKRACFQCHHKKIKCDKERPSCGLCARVGDICTFPTMRKVAEARRSNKRPASIREKISLTDGHRSRRNLSSVDQPIFNASSSPDSPLSNFQFRQSPAPALQNPSKHGRDSNPVMRDRLDGEAQQVVKEILPSPSSTEPQPVSASRSSYASRYLSSDQHFHLVSLYFDRIQPWLPLLHRPRFYSRYMGGDVVQLDKLSLEERLIFFSMFALAARFSTISGAEGIHPVERGKVFAEEAKMLYSTIRSGTEPSSLVYLQGCILLAFYFYTSGPCPRGWILTGVCVRLAYELDLNNIDTDDRMALNREEWVLREELRRAWWLVWELDTFGSTLSARPYMVDRRRMKVMLPVSDNAWFAESPVVSTKLRSRPSEAWGSLQNCANQDERAWFLIANYLLSIASDLSQMLPEVSQEEMYELETACKYFKLALPPSFNLELGDFGFNRQNFATCNWIICTHLMINACTVLISNLKKARLIDGKDSVTLSSCGQSEARLHTAEISRIVNHWTPDYISAAHPFIFCTMIPVHTPSITEDSITADDAFGDNIVSKLLLSHCARVWALGTIMLSLLDMLEQPEGQMPTEFSVLKHYAIYFPNQQRPKAGSITTKPVSDTSSDRPQKVNNGFIDVAQEGHPSRNSTRDTMTSLVSPARDPTPLDGNEGNQDLTDFVRLDSNSQASEILPWDIDIDSWDAFIPTYLGSMDEHYSAEL